MYDGRKSHFFTCAAQPCKGKAQGVRRFQYTSDKSSTANLKHHAIRCFGQDTVTAALKGGPPKSSIFTAFAFQGQRAVTDSHRTPTSLEMR